MKLSKKAILLFTMGLALATTGCGSGKGPEGVVAKVNDVEISQDTYNTYYRIQRQQYVDYLGEETLNEVDETGVKTYGQGLREYILENLITQQVILNEAKKENIDVSTEVEEQIKSEVDYLGADQFQEALKSMKLTEDAYRELTRDNLVVSNYQENKMNTYEFSDDEINTYYESNKSSLQQVRASHILVETEEEANNAIKRLEAGESFEDLAKELSIDTGSAVNGGVLGFFGKGVMVPEFEEYSFSGEVGAVSDPVKSQFGYHIIKITEKNDSAEGSREQIINALKAEKFQADLKALVDSAKIERFIDVTKEPESIKAELEAAAKEAETTEETTEEKTEETTEEKPVTP